MVRVQLYLSEVAYDELKIKARQKKMTFAGYVREKLGDAPESKKKKVDVYKKLPFLKVAEEIRKTVKGKPIDYSKLDELLYGDPYGL